MSFRDFLAQNTVYLDGGTGTLLQAAGLQPGEATETWSLTHPDELVRIHRAYFDAGSHVVATNTFGVNGLKYSAEEVFSMVAAAVANARKAMEESTSGQEKFVALDVGPTGHLLKPLGDLDFEDAVNAFAVTVRAGVEAGADLILIETMNDCLETKAALLAAKEHSDLPVIVSNAYGTDGRMMSGTEPEIMVALLEGMGADAIGVNCSFGPSALAPVVERYLACASVPVICKPNAGMPHVEDGKTVFDIAPEAFADQLALLMEKGVRCAGGCCGTTPDYIRALVSREVKPAPLARHEQTVVTSGTKRVVFGTDPVLIGERINPTGKKRLKQALAEGDIAYLLHEGLNQQKQGAAVLDVNVGTPDVDEKALLVQVSAELQAVCEAPLQLDTADPVAMERALRRYNGKALINSVNGKEACMHAIFPLVKKYGGVVVALTLDENGIPADAAGRVAIAEKILAVAASYGIAKKDILFDPLTMTVSADGDAANVTLQAVRRITNDLGCHTLLGVSNVSFGLPDRPAVNGVFFTMALEAGLSAAIMNPYSQEMMTAYHAWRALRKKDTACLDYIRFAEGRQGEAAPAQVNTTLSLGQAVEQGLKEQAARLAQAGLAGTEPLQLVQEEIIPALNRVGVAFEAQKLFLPQLLMAAEAAGSAFEVIKASMQKTPAARAGAVVVLATVKGDIHDIGKNIVKLLLENYGFTVVDLGRDVPAEAVLEAALAHRAPVVGLSALMTTTVPAMEETIALLHQKAPGCRIIVGGAVLTREYASKIGADAYAADAMETVRLAQKMTE